MAENQERSLAIDIDYLGVAEPGDGVPGTEFTQYPDIHEGSVVFNFNEPTQVNFRVYGRKDPWASFDKAGEPDSIDFAIPSPKVSEMKDFCGGTVDGDKWEEPIDLPNIIKSFRIRTAPYNGKYVEYTFPKCKVLGRISQAPGVEDTDLLLVRATKLSVVTAAGQKMTAFTREIKSVEKPAPEG